MTVPTSANRAYYNRYPFNVDGRGRTASATSTDYIKQLVEQVLFTAVGERVNRPTFGSGVNQLVFSPNSNELASATQLLVHGALQQWLGDLIHVESVVVRNEDSSLHVVVHYIIKRSQQRQSAEFTRES
ncbi:phage baseplate assembly protein W [Candidatus Nitrososphaera evergladensis SR1]|uniref:Phage baseplate assembly protein W n=1 Tax=Candidatus Nitrososphaera evergladensis SR1 TaxID=1459636 RepID=A0A075MN45_9ARCH|nr:GPW/gp25 family protein [Candidatus Nitrososphaera evergladensis]AIF82570.1 phage baseplate assembly protein W [Candidatus Nitrososphaera evergladensis SR1]